MTRFLPRFTWGLACFLLLLCGAAHAQKFVIQGTVRDAQTDAPLDRTWIGLYNSERLLQQTWTDEKGFYRLPAQEGDWGTYWLDIRSTDEDYAPARQAVEVSAWDSIDVPIRLGEQAAPVFTLQGTVREENSARPLEGVWVGLSHRSKNLYALTDAEGYFELIGRGVPGYYRLDAKPVRTRHRTQSQTIHLKSPGLNRIEVSLPALAESARFATPEIVFPVEGRIVIAGTNLSVRACFVTLFRGREIVGQCWSDSEGCFQFEDVRAEPGTFGLLVEPHELFLEPVKLDIQVTEQGARKLRIEVPPREGRPVVVVNFSGEVFSMGGGKGLGWIKVTLLQDGVRLRQTWTNDFGRYEILDVAMPEGEATLLFQSLYPVYFPVAIQKKIERSGVIVVSPVLPAMNPAPVARVRLQGELSAQYTGEVENANLTLLYRGFPVARSKAAWGRFDWPLDLPLGDYELELVHPGRILALRNVPVHVTGNDFPLEEYTLRLTPWAYAWAFAALLAIAASIRVALVYFQRWRLRAKDLAMNREGH